jgi:hypothetical protein
MLGKERLMLLMHLVSFETARPESPNLIDNQQCARLKYLLKPIGVGLDVR